jgi:hypothetical protein
MQGAGMKVERKNGTMEQSWVEHNGKGRKRRKGKKGGSERAMRRK